MNDFFIFLIIYTNSLYNSILNDSYCSFLYLCLISLRRLESQKIWFLVFFELKNGLHISVKNF